MRLKLDKIASSTRNALLHEQVVLGAHIPARAGTVVAVRVLDDKATYNQIEDVGGRMMKVNRGDVVAGVLGAREALHGYSGVVPTSVRVGDELHLLNLGGVIGQCTSANPGVGAAARVEVLGAILRFPELGRRVGEPASIFPGPVALASSLDPLPPAVFVVGTCMHAGKTAAACALVRGASRLGRRVGVAKVTGVALRRDVLEMVDEGAVCAATFADVGYPSTVDVDVVPAARGCLNSIAQQNVDLLVVELGDGLLGDYGVMDVLRDLGGAASAIVLAANDPVGAWGGQQILARARLRADVITGPATDNEAGCRSVRTNCGATALNARTQADLFVAHVLGRVFPVAAEPVALAESVL